MSGTIGSSQGGIDYSIPLRAGQGVAQPNPLQAVGQFAAAQNAINQAKLFPLIQQQHELAAQQEALKYGLSAYQALQSRIATHLGDAGDINPRNLMRDGVDWATDLNAAFPNRPPIQMSQVVSMLSRLPMPDSGVDWRDPKYQATLRDSLRTAYANTLGPLERLGHLTDHTIMVDQGSTVQPALQGGLLSGRAGEIRPVGAPIEKGLTPSELGTQETRPATEADVAANPNLKLNQPLLVPRGHLLGQQNYNRLVNPAPIGGSALPPSLRNPARTPAAQPTPPSASLPAAPATPTPVAGGLGPAQNSALAATGTQSASAFQSIADQGAKARAQDAILANMQADAAQFVTGPGAEGIKQFKSIMVRLGDSIGRDFGIDKEALAANVSFDKLANQIADAQGAGSDARLAVNQAANPSSHLTPSGVDLVLRQLRGNADYIVARANAAAKYPDKADREGFEAKVGANLDPRVFQFQRMTPAQRAAYYKGLTDKDAFKKAYSWAEQNKLIGGGNVGQ